MAMNIQELQAALNAANARNTELEAQLQKQMREVTVGMAEYGQGTVSIRGINRFPISIYPGQEDLVERALPMVREFAKTHAQELRAAAYAAEYVAKAGKKWDNTKGATNQDYKITYSTAYNQALKDTELVSSKSVKAQAKQARK